MVQPRAGGQRRDRAVGDGGGQLVDLLRAAVARDEEPGRFGDAALVRGGVAARIERSEGS